MKALPTVLRAQASALRAQAEALDAIACDAERDDSDDVIDRDTCGFLGLTPRAFTDHARAADFPAYRAGRRLVAKRADVEAWIGSRRVTKPAKADPGGDDRAAMTAAAARLAG